MHWTVGGAAEGFYRCHLPLNRLWRCQRSSAPTLLTMTGRTGLRSGRWRDVVARHCRTPAASWKVITRTQPMGYSRLRIYCLRKGRRKSATGYCKNCSILGSFCVSVCMVSNNQNRDRELVYICLNFGRNKVLTKFYTGRWCDRTPLHFRTCTCMHSCNLSTGAHL